MDEYLHQYESGFLAVVSIVRNVRDQCRKDNQMRKKVKRLHIEKALQGQF